MNNIDLKNLDKSDWKTFRFDEIVKNVSERVDPNNTDLDIYIGLEHLDKESIHIKRTGTPDQVNGQKLKCYPGDIIFGKRRAYQRKASLVTEEAICSAHAFVLRANPEIIEPALLPFFLHSNLFMHRAVDISAGGLSPTINWGVLKTQEFLLPPKEQQAELAELLWSMDEVIEKELAVLDSVNTVVFTHFKQIFSNSTSKKKLIELCAEKPKYGANSPAIEYDGSVRYLRITDIKEMSELGAASVSAKEHDEKYLLEYGDFLLARSADPGRAYYYRPKDGVCTHAGYLIKFKLDLNKVLPEYLYLYTQTKEFKSWIAQTTRKGTLSNINSKEFSSLKVPHTSIEKQKEAIEDAHSKIDLLKLVYTKVESSKSLQKSLINQVF